MSKNPMVNAISVLAYVAPVAFLFRFDQKVPATVIKKMLIAQAKMNEAKGEIR